MRQKLEYGSIIWDDCTEVDRIRIEDLQLQFFRIITGAKRGTKHKHIYDEIMLPRLSERRYESKLKFIYRIVNNKAPDYLCELLPNTVNIETGRSLRNHKKLELKNSKTL